MNDEGAVSKEGAKALVGGRKVIGVGGVEWIRADGAVLAREVTDLASLREIGVASRGL